jgi:hypothetical protein
MANDFTGRIWKITTGGTATLGANTKIKGGQWSGFTASGQTFIITDAAGRSYTFVSTGADGYMPIYELGWLDAPIIFSGTFTGEIDLFLAGGK